MRSSPARAGAYERWIAVKTAMFISYARNDDEPFVKRLYGDLYKRGLAAWWDRERMESRGLAFRQEIREAEKAAERLILVVGPKAAQSSEVQAE
jgi:TIR domain